MGNFLRRVNWFLKVLCSEAKAFYHSVIMHIKNNPDRQTSIGSEWIVDPLNHNSFLPNTRTNARREELILLEARYPWLTGLHGNLFMQGFDAGEWYALGGRTTPQSRPKGDNEKNI